MRAQTREVLTHGLLAGVLGYAIVAGFYAAWNLLQGRTPLYTAAALGAALIPGAEHPDEVSGWAGPVLAVNGLHLMIFIAAGMLAAWFTTLSEHGTARWYLILSLLMYGVIHAVGMALLLSERFTDAIPIWTAVAATLLALTAMLFYLMSVHPALRRTVREYEEEHSP